MPGEIRSATQGPREHRHLRRGLYTGAADAGSRSTGDAVVYDAAGPGLDLQRAQGVPDGVLVDEHCTAARRIRFDKRTRDLYIADAYFGLSKVGPECRLAICVLYIAIASLVSAPTLRDYGIIGAVRPLVGYFTSYIYHPLN
ncbi:hypothetical protein ZWY2020_024590 [Hordeum vulgare]|nr:hypothetical protein ZWY2020_024590 [Hordeum vulgare]